MPPGSQAAGESGAGSGDRNESDSKEEGRRGAESLRLQTRRDGSGEERCSPPLPSRIKEARQARAGYESGTRSSGTETRNFARTRAVAALRIRETSPPSRACIPVPQAVDSAAIP